MLNQILFFGVVLFSFIGYLCQFVDELGLPWHVQQVGGLFFTLEAKQVLLPLPLLLSVGVLPLAKQNEYMWPPGKPLRN